MQGLPSKGRQRRFCVRGELARSNGDLARLIGRPTTPLAETVKAALAR